MTGRVNKFTSAYQNHSNVTDQVVAMMQNDGVEEVVPQEQEEVIESSEPISQEIKKTTEETAAKPKKKSAPTVPQLIEQNEEPIMAIRPMGRPKVYDYKMHPLQTRIREDLFEYAQEQCGKNKKYQSVNAYINELILRDMLNNQ